jgi:enoyl-CoA hydratase/carnithine racemase
MVAINAAASRGRVRNFETPSRNVPLRSCRAAWSAALEDTRILLLDILLGGDDIPAVLAAEYGYVNRVVPDTDIEGFVDAFARRIATFDKVAVAGIKKLVDVATLPEDAEFAPGLQVYFATAGRPENRPFTERLLREGLQQPDGIETDLGTAIGTLRREQ